MPNWTREQQNAIEYAGGELLVSAAAGSGKTAVLVERVLRRLTDPNGPSDISRFLIVTFTNAAAAEMREKIRTAIEERIREDPTDRHLIRQLHLLPNARIGTVHNFCFGLIRAHFQSLSLPASLRIAGEAECEQIRNRVIEKLLEEAYDDPERNDTDFWTMVDQIVDARNDDRLKEQILKQSEVLLRAPDPEGQARRALSAYDAKPGQIAQGIWGREILRRVRQVLKYSIDRYDEAMRLIAETGLCRPYLERLEAERDAFETALNALAGTWDDVHSAMCGIDFQRLSKAEDCELKQLIKDIRDRTKKEINQLKEDVFCESEQDICDALPEQAATARALLSLSITFIKRFREEKQAKGLVDFSDLEHYAYQLLVEREGEDGLKATACAREIGAGFEEVMVDEYQDTNRLQDGIFRALTTERGNLFMVGDVKQSIYRFRNADPTIFLEKQRRFAPVTDPKTDRGMRRVALSSNFRSRAQVLDAVNAVFERICIPAFSEITYGEEDRLHVMRPDPPDRCYDAELHMLCTDRDASDEENEAPETSDAIALRIRELLDSGMMIPRKEGESTPIRPEDVAVLVRSDAGTITEIARALARRNVPCRAEQGESLCEALEVQSALASLEAVCNPLDDISILAFLRSPGISFDAEMLASLRAVRRNGRIFGALTEAAKTDPAAKEALDTLSALRKMARRESVGAVLRETCKKLCITAGFGAMENGEIRRQNIAILQGIADAFDANGGGDLRTFLSYMKAMETRNERREPVPSTDAVHIMTIHRSKGLEFPVVILADAGKQFNMMDSKESVLLHGDLGIATRRRDTVRRLSFSTLPLRAIRLRINRESMAEQLRILYVALTRAREKLIVFTAKKEPDRYISGLRRKLLGGKINAKALSDSVGAGDWLWLSMLDQTNGGLESFGPDMPYAEAGPWRLIFERASVGEVSENSPSVSETEEAETLTKETTTAEDLAKRAFASYAHPAAAAAPSKRTVTQLKGREKDAELDEGLPVPKEVPEFLSERHALGTERGTAVHMVLSHIDFAHTGLADVRECIDDMRRRQLLTPEEAELASADQIARFFESPLGIRLCTPGAEVLREFKFSVLVPAETVADMGEERGETIMLQGVADALVVEKNGILLLDYKTDRPNGSDLSEWLSRKTEEYRFQIETYAKALERIFNRPVTEKYLCFLAAGENVRV